MFKTKKNIIREINGKFQYPIIIGKKIIQQINNLIKNEIKHNKVFIIYDDYFDENNDDVLHYLNLF